MREAIGERLLDREHEIARLADVLERAAGGTGAAVMVEGPPGIGKTSLLDVAAELADGFGLAALRARSGELEQALAFGVARELLARRVADATGDLRSRLHRGAGAAALPSLGLGDPPDSPSEAVAVQFGLTWLVADLADEQPLALIVDDLQWSDAESAAWLAHLARRLGDLAVAMLLAARPPAGDGEPAGVTALRELPELSRMRPQPLERPSVAALVRTFYAADAEDEFIAMCHRVGGGNPFHTQAMLDAAAAEEIPATATGALALGALAPEAVQRSVAAGVRRAGEGGAALARACATLGDSAELQHAAALAGLDAASAAAALDRLVAQAILAPGWPLRFVHPVLRSAVRESVPPGERDSLHRRAAELFTREGDARRAAVHLLEVEPAGDADVVATLTAAAGHALAEGAARHAARLLERALAEPPRPEDRPRLLGRLGRARTAAGHGAAAEPLLAAADATEDPEERAHLLADAGWATLWEQPDAIEEVTRRVAELPPALGQGRMRAQAMMATTLRWAGRPAPPAAELVAQAERLAGDTPAERELLTAAALAAGLEAAPAERIVSLGRRALRAPEETPPDALWTAADIMVGAGATEEVYGPLDAALAASRRRGSQSGVEGLLQARILADWRAGRFRAAEVDARVMWRLAEEKPAGSPSWALALGRLLQTLAWRGLVDEGAELADRHGPFPRDSPSYIYDILQVSAGAVAFERGDLQDALESALAFDRALVRRKMDAAGFCWHRPIAVEALVRLGEPVAARALAERELQLARRLGAPGTLGFALRTMGLAVGGSQGRALLEQALPLLERSGEADRLTRTLLDLGRSLRLDGRPTDARAPLRRAMELADRCGADLVFERGFDELRATGAKPRRRALTGPGSLTASETRIARLAAEGRTNREIAQVLFVSAKTVETHLGHVYAKLGVGGRSELAAALMDERDR